jgi:hypothetical protein
MGFLMILLYHKRCGLGSKKQKITKNEIEMVENERKQEQTGEKRSLKFVY